MSQVWLRKKDFQICLVEDCIVYDEKLAREMNEYAKKHGPVTGSAPFKGVWAVLDSEPVRHKGVLLTASTEYDKTRSNRQKFIKIGEL